MTFTEARDAELLRVLKDIQRQEEAALRVRLTRRTWEACPASIGNDPCDDVDPYDDEDF